MRSEVSVEAFSQCHNFYPSVVYITKSNPSMAVIYLKVGFHIFVPSLFKQKLFHAVFGALDINWQADEKSTAYPMYLIVSITKAFGFINFTQTPEVADPPHLKQGYAKGSPSCYT